MEVASLLLIVGIVYGNIFLLVPQLWNKGKKWLYVLTFLLAVLCTAGLELLMCKEIVAQKVLPYTDLHTYRMYLFDIFVSLSLRNGSFLMFSTLYVMYKLKSRTVRQREKYISTHTENIVLFFSDECKEVTVTEIVSLRCGKETSPSSQTQGSIRRTRYFQNLRNCCPPVRICASAGRLWSCTTTLFATHLNMFT